MSYRIGNPLEDEIQSDEFEDIEDAEEAAIQASFDDHLWGVWDVQTSLWVSLAFRGSLFC
jgi:hypothetical protein